MRIETWDLKIGDNIIVHTSTNEYTGMIIEGPWESNGWLFVRFERLPKGKFNWLSRYDDKKNIWVT